LAETSVVQKEIIALNPGHGWVKDRSRVSGQVELIFNLFINLATSYSRKYQDNRAKITQYETNLRLNLQIFSYEFWARMDTKNWYINTIKGV